MQVLVFALEIKKGFIVNITLQVISSLLPNTTTLSEIQSLSHTELVSKFILERLIL